MLLEGWSQSEVQNLKLKFQRYVGVLTTEEIRLTEKISASTYARNRGSPEETTQMKTK